MTTKFSPDHNPPRLVRRGRAMDIIVRRDIEMHLGRKAAQIPSAPVSHEALEEEPLGEKAHQEEIVRSIGSLRKRPLMMPAGVLLVLGALGAGIWFIKPSAAVTVYPKEETVEFEMDLSGRTDISSIDIAKAIVPLERFHVEETTEKEFPSSGLREVVSRAHGKLTVYNAFSSSPQPVVATTRFLAESGKLFRTPKAVAIPGAKVEGGKLTPGSVEIAVAADQAGEEYNISPSRFSIPGFAGTSKEGKFYAESREPMAGGFKGSARVVEKKDIEASRASFVPQEIDRVSEALRKKFPPDLHYADGALFVTSVQVSVLPKDGEPGEKFMLTVKTSAEALLFREQDVLRVIEPNIEEHLAAKYRTLPNTRKVSYTVRQYDPALRLAFTTLVSVRRQAVINEEELRARLASMDISQAKTFFAGQDHIERVNLSLWPFWSRRIPSDTSRVKVIMGKK